MKIGRPPKGTTWLVADELLDIWQRDGFLRTRDGRRLDIVSFERNEDGSVTPTLRVSDDGFMSSPEHRGGPLS